MTHEEFKKSIKAGVQEAIKTGQAKMRPRAYYVARTILLIIGSVLLGLLLIYLVSFIFFMLKVTGVWFVPAFGAAGIMPFVLALPWLLILVAIIFIFVLEWVFKRYSLAWRKPLLYSAVGIVVLVLVFGFVVAQTSLHKGAYRKAEEGKLPLVGQMYKDIEDKRKHNIHKGKITELTEQGFVMDNFKEKLITVIITPATRQLREVKYEVGDVVLLIGEFDEDYQLKAVGIRKTDDEDFMFMHHGGGVPGMHLRNSSFPKPGFK